MRYNIGMIRHGAKPSKLDVRDYSFHKTFPLYSAVAPAALPNLDYSFDAGITMPDQIEEGFPFGCTGYCQTDCKCDQDKFKYDASYTYKNTCYMEGHEENQGCDIRTSVKSLRVYGARRVGKSEADAVNNKSGQAFSIEKVPGRDWFDSFRIALRSQRSSKKNNSISVGTIWFPEWASPPQNGLLTSHFTFSGDINAYNWHNFKISGEKTIDGYPTLEVKSWQGKNVGNGGWLYMDRETFNKAFDIYGTIGLITLPKTDADVQTIELDLLQTVLVYLNRWLALIGHNIPLHA